MGGGGTSDLDRTEERVWRSHGLTPRHHDVPLTEVGTTVHVTEVGDPAGPPVLFVHGGSVAGPSWHDLVAELPTFRCLLLDRPGWGRSAPLEIDSVQGLLDLADVLVVDVMDGLGLDRASVVGTSYGGAFALRAAARHPHRVDRLVLLAWCLGMPNGSPPLRLRIGTMPGLRHLSAVAPPPPPRLVRILLASFGMRRAVAEGRFSDEAIDWLAALYRETDTLRSEVQIAGPAISLRNGWDDRLTWSEELLAQVTAPTLVLYGDEDHLGTVQGARSLVERMPDVRVEILSEAGHAPWLDRLDPCATAMRDHLTIADA